MPTSKINLREALGPSQFAAERYLGNDDRSPEDIIESDRQELARLDMTKEKIASALRELYIRAERALGNPVKLPSGIVLKHEEARGRIPSPFPGDGTFQKGQVQVTDKTSGSSFSITPLSIHLIEKYCFFQGKGSGYRIEPAIAAKFAPIDKID